MDEIRVQVCYALPESQYLQDLILPAGATVQMAIEESGVLREVPGINLAAFRVGVYGKLKSLEAVLRDHDRVEIYRPLIADPKESRRKRAVKKDEKKARS
jgi:uncharacterized protein